MISLIILHILLQLIWVNVIVTQIDHLYRKQTSRRLSGDESDATSSSKIKSIDKDGGKCFTTTTFALILTLSEQTNDFCIVTYLCSIIFEGCTF